MTFSPQPCRHLQLFVSDDPGRPGHRGGDLCGAWAAEKSRSSARARAVRTLRQWHVHHVQPHIVILILFCGPRILDSIL